MQHARNGSRPFSEIDSMVCKQRSGEGTMTTANLITIDPEILSGTPVFTGTRVPVESLIDHLKAGDSLEDFLEGFPGVQREQAEAFLELALDAALSHARAA